MKNNKLVIENGDSCEKYDILLNIEVTITIMLFIPKENKMNMGILSPMREIMSFWMECNL